MIPATCLQNWDLLLLLKLLKCKFFSVEVREAAEKMRKYTRTDLAHERFDCDWERDCSVMAELLDALGKATNATRLRDFCKSKAHKIHAGESASEVVRIVI